MQSGLRQLKKLPCMLNFEHSRDHRQGSELFLGSGLYEVVSFAHLTSGVFIVTSVGFELATLCLEFARQTSAPFGLEKQVRRQIEEASC